MNIISFTEVARNHIQNMLKKHGKNHVFRLSIKKTGCSGYMYVPEIFPEKKSEDHEVKLDDHFFIYLDPDCIDKIKGTTVDYVKKNFGVSQLEFHNPNAESLCGCGESFNLKEKS